MGDHSLSWTVGCWAVCRNNLATFASNPQYLVILVDPDENDEEDKCTMIVNLMQKGRRAMMGEGKDLVSIGFVIYAVFGSSSQRLVLTSSAIMQAVDVQINMRQVSGRFKLPPGNYVIVPSSFHKHEEGDFLLRIFTEAPKHSESLEEF